jgi:hypothetical protein
MQLFISGESEINMGKIADMAQSVASLGLIAASTGNAMGIFVRQVMQDVVEFERSLARLKSLAVPDVDVQCHCDVVKQLALSSPFPNRIVEQVGMELARRRAARGESIIPEDAYGWAQEFWKLLTLNYYDDIRETMFILCSPWRLSAAGEVMELRRLAQVWTSEAERLWSKVITESEVPNG